MLIFMDETGLNPLPSGVLVTIVGSVTGPAAAYTRPGGTVNINVAGGTSAFAAFFGTQGPQLPQAFTAADSGDTTITVDAYRSPRHSAAGMTTAQIELWPRGWFGDVARAQGGVAFALATGLSAALCEIDNEVDIALAAQRLYTSSGTQIDTWAADYFGVGVYPRVAGEQDDAYVARIELRLRRWLTTLPCMTAVVNAYLGAIGYTAAIVQVFDQDSDPQLAGLVGIAPPQFCILFTFPYTGTRWILGESKLGETTFLGGSTYTLGVAVSAEFDALVRGIKAIGTKPVYASNGQGALP